MVMVVVIKSSGSGCGRCANNAAQRGHIRVSAVLWEFKRRSLSAKCDDASSSRERMAEGLRRRRSELRRRLDKRT